MLCAEYVFILYTEYSIYNIYVRVPPLTVFGLYTQTVPLYSVSLHVRKIIRTTKTRQTKLKSDARMPRIFVYIRVDCINTYNIYKWTMAKPNDTVYFKLFSFHAQTERVCACICIYIFLAQWHRNNDIKLRERFVKEIKSLVVCAENKSYAPEQISQTINLERVDEFSAIFFRRRIG